LLDNAIRYTPAQGTVTLSLRREGDAVVLEVEDSGPGIDDDQIPQALLPFHRLENVGDNPGAGLGLALVSDIARLHRSHPQLLRSTALGGLKVSLRFLAAAPARSEQTLQG
jgi:two-component system, OmpR family, sensor histidine kinase TctE